MKNYIVEYETVVKARTIVEAEDEKDAEKIVCCGITGSTDILSREHNITLVKHTYEPAIAFRPKKAHDTCNLHASKGPKEFVDMIDPRKVGREKGDMDEHEVDAMMAENEADLEDLSEIISDVQQALAFDTPPEDE